MLCATSAPVSDFVFATFYSRACILGEESKTHRQYPAALVIIRGESRQVPA
jgi:hypothetical protein